MIIVFETKSMWSYVIPVDTELSSVALLSIVSLSIPSGIQMYNQFNYNKINLKKKFSFEKRGLCLRKSLKIIKIVSHTVNMQSEHTWASDPTVYDS